MIRFLPAVTLASTLIVSSAVFAAPAHAENLKTVPVTLTYDMADLDSSTRAISVLKDLEQQARGVCTTITPIIQTKSVDTECVANVLEQAVAKIGNDVLTAAYKQSPTLALRVAAANENQG